MSNQHDQDQLIAVAARVLMQNYRQQPAVMRRGSGCELEDVAGRRYLDMTAGISVCALGHSHPALQRILAEQGGRLQHVSNLYFVEEQILAAQALAERCFGDRVFFCNSGSEANEAALKLARRYAHVVAGQDRDLVVATDGSFHGRSFATVAVTGQPKYHEGFGPLLQPVASVPFGDLEAARRALARARPARSSSSRSRPRAASACPRPDIWPGCASCATRPAPCSSSTRSRPASAAPGAGSATSTTASPPTS
jgi:acetylornithine/N-succinyldiaminopimelate aminotransferase